MRFSAELALLLVCSASLYSAGIVLNDLADREIDRVERPQRPLPAGRVTVRTAWMLGIILVIVGLGTSYGAEWVRPMGNADIGPAHRALFIACALVAAIFLYDFVIKATPAGPILLGVCRALNLVLGMSHGWWGRWDLRCWAIIAVFAYVTSLSFFGRHEAGVSRRGRLVPAGAGIVLSLLMLGFLATMRMVDETFTLIVWLALLIHLVRVTVRTVRNPGGPMVQYAMKTFVLGLIAFDAVIASAAHGWPAGVIVLTLLAPAVVLGRWVYST
jgi:4-hydroxybenzoate polyprenyltransferase